MPKSYNSYLLSHFRLFLAYFGVSGVLLSCRGRVVLKTWWDVIPFERKLFREEHSMDQYRSRLKLSENFERRWSIPFPGEIHMDQSFVHTFSWGNSYGPMVLKVLLKVSPYTGIGPWMALPSYYIINSETIVDVNYYIKFSIINSETIYVM